MRHALQACLIAIGVAAASAAEGAPLRVLGDRDYPPATYLESGVAKGFDIDVLAALGEALGREIRVELMPWDEAQKRVQSGDADLVTGMSITEERRAQWEFASPTVSRTFSLFVRSGDVTIHGVPDLAGKRVGVTRGGLPRAVIGAKPGVTIVLIADYEEGFERLKAGAIDAVAADTWVAGFILNKEHLQGVGLAGEPFASLPSAIAAPKGKHELIAEVNRGLDLLRSRGTIDQIRRRWEPKQVVVLLREEVASYVAYAAGAIGAILIAGLAAWIVMLMRQARLRRKLDAELRQFRAAIDASADLVTLIDPAKKRYIDVNDTTCRTLGYRKAELLAKDPAEVFSVEGLDLHKSYEQMIGGDQAPASVEGSYRRKDGTTFPVEALRRTVSTGEGDIIVAIARDITQRKQSEASIRHLTRVYAVLSGINGVIVRSSDRDAMLAEACRVAVEAGQFRMAWVGLLEPGSTRLKPVAWAGDVRDYLERLPADLTEAVPGGRGLGAQAILALQPTMSNDVRKDPRIVMHRELEDRGINSLVVLPLITDGKPIGALSLYAAEPGFFDEKEMRLLQELAGDISFALDHLEKARAANYLAYYDSLTGVANRTLFLERLAQSVSAAASEQRKFALVIVNIERFKSINDAFGRQAGDALLQQVTARLREFMQDANRIARVGPDHFAVIAPPQAKEEDLIRRVEQGLRRLSERPYAVGGSEHRISAQAGIALYPDDGANAETLFLNAEEAMRKAGTGDRYVFYTRQMTERVAEKLELENKLKLALDRDEFVLHYQPKVDLEARRILGLEALIRWQSTELGLVPPMKFIPLMEETGLILQVGSWALRRATQDHRRLAELGLKAPRIAVNVSPIQLRQRDFVDVLRDAISDGAPTGCIDLEITESLIMEDIQASIEKLGAARQLGVQIAIDDFGTGYSSLAYLSRLPVQSLKIDRSFVIAMLRDPDTLTVVSTIISLARSLKLKVVAEGVDDEEQAKLLRSLHCDEMQGYLFSKPVPLDAVAGLLVDSR